MRRREFILGLGGAAAWPAVARAQQRGRVRRIGILINSPERDAETQALVAAFRQGLEKLGWLEGRDVRLDARFAANADSKWPLYLISKPATQPVPAHPRPG